MPKFIINSYLLASRLLSLGLFELTEKGPVASQPSQLDLAVGLIRQVADAEGQKTDNGKQERTSFFVEAEILAAIVAHATELLDSGVLAKCSCHGLVMTKLAEGKFRPSYWLGRAEC